MTDHKHNCFSLIIHYHCTKKYPKCYSFTHTLLNVYTSTKSFCSHKQFIWHKSSFFHQGISYVWSKVHNFVSTFPKNVRKKNQNRWRQTREDAIHTHRYTCYVHTVQVVSNQPMTAQRGMMSEQRTSLDGWITAQIYRIKSHLSDWLSGVERYCNRQGNSTSIFIVSLQKRNWWWQITTTASHHNFGCSSQLTTNSLKH